MKKYLIITLSILLFLISCQNQNPAQEIQVGGVTQKQFSDQFFLMDTVVNIKIFSKQNPTKLLKETKKIMNEDEKRFDRHNPESEISLLNKDRKIFTEYDKLYDLIFKSSIIDTATNGYFCVKLGKLLEFWNPAGKKYEEFPYNPESFRSSIFAGKIFQEELKPPMPTIPDIPKAQTSLKGDFLLELGGIAKGYIIDYGYYYLKANGIKAGLINAGGDVLVWGGKYKRTGCWTVGIQVPNKPQGTFDYIVKLKDGAVTTSGDYERFFYVGDKKFHHIINTRTMLPSDQAHSVTVIIDKPVFLFTMSSQQKAIQMGNSKYVNNISEEQVKQFNFPLLATEADALSTAIMCMPKEEARKFCNENNIKAIIYERDMNVFISAPLKNSKKIKLERKNNADK
ncbi:FAD:protein FMN transferase [Candidatus Dependentiae bacterium]|nr:FAD:protein FMN transferase [Candidatus Dependentiae bacterium]